MDIIADKASRLFQFLADLQSQKEHPVRRISAYGPDSQWMTLTGIAESADAAPLSIRFEQSIAEDLGVPEMGATVGDAALLRIERPTAPAQLAVPKELEQYLTGPADDPKKRPDFDFASVGYADMAALQQSADAWSAKWDTWSLQVRAQNDYQRFFDMHVKSTQQADEYELVLGAGWLSWELDSDETIDRPIFTVPVEMAMDKSTGAIEVRESGEPVRAELEVLSVNRIADGRFVEDLKGYLSAFEGQISRLESFSDLGGFTANGLSTDAQYEPLLRRSPSDGRPVMTWAPTLILRPRQRIGLSQTFRDIARTIELGGDIPSGLRPLVDPNYEAETLPTEAPGAIVNIGGELFSPLPLNEKQKRVVEHVDQHAHTIVQGPPGTGKTHMAAALLSHLLAQGKRVLVTAQTERALYELRGKLPAEVRELAVSVIGSGSQEMTDLRTAIETIQHRSSNFDEQESQRKITQLERDLDILRERRTRILREWVSELEDEQRSLAIPGYDTSIPQAIELVRAHRTEYCWIDDLEMGGVPPRFPLSREDIDLLSDLLSRPALPSPSSVRSEGLLDPRQFASDTEFNDALHRVQRAADKLNEARAEAPSHVLHIWESLKAAEKHLAVDVLQAILQARQDLEHSGLPWASELPPGIGREGLNYWESRRHQVSEKLERLSDPLSAIDDVQRVTINGPFDQWVPAAQGLLAYLQGGKTLTLRPDGSVKVPLIGGNTVKAFVPFIDSVRINGLPPTTVDLVGKYLAYVSVAWELQGLSNLWPFAPVDLAEPAASVTAIRSDMDKLALRLQQISSVEETLSTLRRFGFNLTFDEASALALQVPELQAVAEAGVGYEEANHNFKSVSGQNRLNSYDGAREPWIAKLERAIADGDAVGYRYALSEGENAYKASLEAQRLSELLRKLEIWSPILKRKVQAPEARAEWLPRLYEAEDARNWLRARERLSLRTRSERGENLEALDSIDRQIHEAITDLAAERAWSAAAGSERIDGSMRGTMQAYVQAVRRLGKGTGKYAEQHRRDVRRHLDSARPAVPVWIMPIYKVVEQFELKQNMFDVVIIDEASQAGVESIFLQYLAPKVVVVGDDRQVSPSGVGIDRDMLRKMARQYLYDFDKVDAWVDPERSLFDDANMRYGGRIALDEHRRCVPEIIEFSNELVYRPSNIELKPVRQVPRDRLAPFRITRTPNAFESGKKKVNRAEADMLVRRLQQVLDDPRYDGKTIGVISLLSTSGQADYIQNRLLTSLPPSVWEERDLKVGAPADFQGAERDVILLSMVTPTPQEGRLSATTRSTIEQRYNVAVSRAKDQVWLFHSVGLEDFPNHDDLRYKLLEYAYRVAEASPESRESTLVPNDIRVEPFDSLFEQRVYNELVQRGYTVIPQFDAFGRRIDLVVQGENARLAVECDGDYWHSEEYALADQARQRELERLGWTFVRVFESDFYLDKNEQVERIVQRLDELEIHPWSGSEGADHDAESNVEVVETVFDDAEDSHDSSSSEVVFSTSLADPQIQPAETPSAE